MLVLYNTAANIRWDPLVVLLLLPDFWTGIAVSIEASGSHRLAPGGGARGPLETT